MMDRNVYLCVYEERKASARGSETAGCGTRSLRSNLLANWDARCLTTAGSKKYSAPIYQDNLMLYIIFGFFFYA